MTNSALSSPAQTLAGKPTLLFVDDEERILRSLRMLFAQHYKVHVTTSGHDALDILKREKVHAVISDQRMPIMPGVELLRQARDVSPNTMRLLLTGYSDMEAVSGSINEGEIFRFISKPWNPDEIRGTVGTAVDIALRLDSQIHVPRQKEDGSVEHILIIDDDPESSLQVKALLDQHMPGQHVLEWASDVDSVFRILESQNIALVLSEVRLQGEDITQLLKSLKHHHPHVITLVQTSYQDSATMVGLINQAQIHRFLLKPLRPAMVWRGIESGLERHRAMKSAPVLASRHSVEPVATPPEGNAAKRILGFFRSFSKKAV